MSLAAARQQQWQQIVQLTRQMQDLAASDEWQSVVAIESARQARLQAFFAIPVSAEEAADVAEGIRHILDSDRELAQHGLRAQQQVLGSMKDIMSGRRALAAYDNCSGRS
jgi:hypothetical protein